MEATLPQTPPVPPLQEVPVQATVPPRRNTPLLLLIGLFLVLSLWGGAYYLGQQSNKSQQDYLVLASPAASAVVQDEMVGWRTYSDSVITFKHPLDWSFSPNCNNKIALINCVRSPDFNPELLDSSVEKTTMGAFLGMRFNGPQTPESTLSLSDFDLLCRGEDESFKGTCTNVAINGKPALRMQQMTNGVVTKETVNIQLSENKQLSITFINTEENAINERMIFDQILSTFTFTDSQQGMEGWKKYTGQTLGISIKYPINYTLITNKNDLVEFGMSAEGISKDFVHLRISNKNSVNIADYKACSKITYDPNASPGPTEACINDNWTQNQNSLTEVRNIGGRQATSFYFSAGGPDNDFHIIQFQNPPLELKMYVAGGGLDTQFEQILSTVTFLN